MNPILGVLLFVGGILVLVTLGAGVLLALAAGLGWVCAHFLHFTLFEGTALSLVALVVVACAAWQLMPTTPVLHEHDEDGGDEDEFEPVRVPRMPNKWRKGRKRS